MRPDRGELRDGLAVAGAFFLLFLVVVALDVRDLLRAAFWNALESL